MTGPRRSGRSGKTEFATRRRPFATGGMVLTQDILLDLLMVLGLAVVLGLGGTFLHRLAARRRSKPARRPSLLLHLLP